jgi:hypothetical protein
MINERPETASAGLRRKIVFTLVCAVLFVFCERDAAGAEVNAENCGIAAGRDAHGNTITCNYGLTSDEIEALTHAAVTGATGPLLDRIESLSKRLGVSEATTAELLKIVGEQPRKPGEDISAILTRVATKYKRLEAQLASTDTDSAVGRALVQQVRTKILSGELQRAGDLLDTITRRVAVLNGNCTNVSAMDISIDSRICLPQLMNVEYVDDRQAFTFTTQRDQETAIISFSGFGPHQFHVSDDDAVQPIDKVIFTFQGSSDHLAAKGTCSFSNPYRGIPSTVSCMVHTSQGTFAGDFVSDGRAPDTFEAGAGQPIVNSNFHGFPEIIKGQCLPSSHVASGLINEDLTKKQSRFFCNSAIIMSFDDAGRHKLIQFVDSESNHSRILGFGGVTEDKSILIVKNVYLEIGRASLSSDGACKFFYDEEKISEIVCGAKIDEGDRRTVPIVSFESATARN